MVRVQFLAVGHVTLDRTSGGDAPGGTAYYAAHTAARLGQRAAVLTSAGPNLDLASALPGIAVHRVSSATTTRFENVTRGGRRQQRILSTAAPLTPSYLPDDWRDVPIVLLGPVAGEVSPELAACFPHTLIGATPQGWMRAWDASGRVRPAPWLCAEAVLPHVQAVFVSDEDVPDLARFAAEVAPRVPVLVVTRGRHGAAVYHGGRVQHVPAYPAREVDPTGAGDVFAAAFLIAYAQDPDPIAAARFACAAASFAVEGQGVASLATDAQVRARMGE